MRVVFDTNIFISALAIPDSLAEQAILRIIEGKDRLILSKSILHEILTTLSRKFGRDREELARVAVYLTEIGEWVDPGRRAHVLRDEPDNRILECAIAGKAALVVTGDREEIRMTKKVRPTHPGEILLEEFIKPLGISQYRLARDTNVPPRRINEIVQGKRSISADTALRLARYFGTTDRFWLNLQSHYELEQEKDRLGKRLVQEVGIFRKTG